MRPNPSRSDHKAIALMYLAFFVLGLVGSMTGPLVPALRHIFALDFRQAMAAQWLVLVVIGALAWPAARLMQSWGVFRLLCLALGLMAAGCLAVSFAAGSGYFASVLLALAVIATGTTLLQVAGNPLTTALGAPEKSHARLALAQGFNSLGVLGGVHLGSSLMLGQDAAQGVQLTYGILAVLTLAGLAMFLCGGKAFPTSALANETAAPSEALTSRWAWAGAAAIALYVGAEGAIGSIMINFLHQPHVLNLPMAEAGRASAKIYWGGALAGRFAGSWLLTRYRAPRLLGLMAALACALCLTVAVTQGPMAGYAALAIGLCNAIMFPTIFSLTLARSKAPASAVSGLLCTAIAGGALISILVGEMADHTGLAQAFLVPLVAYGLIALFAALKPAIWPQG
ncbi:MFS transporter [Novosphingobium umbonatum]|nr:MFS transporter [Novosphingobium umbonatum]